ncbi:hypothetical protein M9434_002071 [Picochlorum sp. BPE23]|nr:hypothetical protein M9434_002071 [Picochlorum sp. BPE23]
MGVKEPVENCNASTASSSQQEEEPEVVSDDILASPIDLRDTLSSIELDDGLIEIHGDIDLVLRVEYMEDSVAMRYIRCLQLGLLLSLIVLIIQAVWVQSDYTSSAGGKRILIMNLVLFCLACLGMLYFGGYHWKNVTSFRLAKKTTSRRRARLTRLAMIDFICLFINTILLIGSDIWLLEVLCSWLYSSFAILAFIRWSLLNMVVANQFLQVLVLLPREALERLLNRVRLLAILQRRNISIPAGIDLSVSMYIAVFLAFYAIPEVTLLLLLLYTVGPLGGYWCSSQADANCSSESDVLNCDPWNSACTLSNYGVGYDNLMIVIGSIFLFYMALYIICCLWADSWLRCLPYSRYKMNHIELGFQMQTRLIVAFIGVLSIVLLWLVSHGSCPVKFMMAVGLSPYLFSLTLLVTISLWMHSPYLPSKSESNQHVRNENIKWVENADVVDQTDVQVCYETMLTAFLFSFMVYELDEVEMPTFELESTLETCSFTDSKLIWNKVRDSKCLIAWSEEQRRIVICFRGTASAKNVLTDLKLWRSTHPPTRGNYLMGTKPMIHAGFGDFWFGSGMKDRCMSMVTEITKCSPDETPLPWRILVCGHSLGGAAAKIAAYDLSDWNRSIGAAHSVMCYTYGSPRVGNSAFVRSYNLMVPNTWNIMHLNDIVIKNGKFLFLYKRDGHCIYLTEVGPIIDPSRIESYTLGGMKSSMQDHLLSKYASSLIALLRFEKWKTPAKQRMKLYLTNLKAFKAIKSSASSMRWALDSDSLGKTADVDIVTGAPTQRGSTRNL